MKQLVAALFCLIVFNAFGQDTTQKIVAGRENDPSQQKKPYVILISADGFRYDYAKRYNAKHLLELSGEGVTSEAMIPSYPSVTFPNHYTLVTGLYPSHHGLVNNTYYDPSRKDFYSMGNKAKVADGSWYFGTPLWVLAEQQHMLASSFYWVASEADIKGTRPTYYYVYNDKIDINRRIQAVVDWLKLPEAKRPHFITFYLPQADHEGHLHGPESPEVERQVHFIDSAVYQLNQAVKATGLPVNFVFVSDHGMTRVDNERPLPMPASVDTSQFVVAGDGTIVELYAKDKSLVKVAYQTLKEEAKGYQVYLKDDMPAILHYSTSDDWHNRMGDILLIPDWPKVFHLGNYKVNPGTHGYDPYKVHEMMATFYAWGPAFKPHTQIGPFQNVNIYPMIAQILGLNITEKIDGTNQLAKDVLK